MVKPSPPTPHILKAPTAVLKLAAFLAKAYMPIAVTDTVDDAPQQLAE